MPVEHCRLALKPVGFFSVNPGEFPKIASGWVIRLSTRLFSARCPWQRRQALRGRVRPRDYQWHQRPRQRRRSMLQLDTVGAEGHEFTHIYLRAKEIPRLMPWAPCTRSPPTCPTLPIDAWPHPWPRLECCQGVHVSIGHLLLERNITTEREITTCVAACPTPARAPELSGLQLPSQGSGRM